MAIMATSPNYIVGMCDANLLLLTVAVNPPRFIGLALVLQLELLRVLLALAHTGGVRYTATPPTGRIVKLLEIAPIWDWG